MSRGNEELVIRFQGSKDESERRQLLGELYQQNAGLITMVARKYRGYDCIEDLQQEAYFGIVTAAERWSPDGGASFSSYAVEWIRQTMQRYIDECGCVIRVPSYRQEKVVQLKKFRSQYEADHGKPPTDREIMAALGVTKDQLGKIRTAEAIQMVRSFSEVVGGEDDSILLEDTIADPDDCIGAAEEKIQRDQLKDMLWTMVNNDLDERQAAVIRKRFKENKSLQECGKDLDITLERVRQIEAKALRKLRSPSRIGRLKSFYEDGERYSRGIKGGSVSRFRQNGESSTEKAALHFLEREELRSAARVPHVASDREYSDAEVTKMIEDFQKEVEAFRMELKELDKMLEDDLI